MSEFDFILEASIDAHFAYFDYLDIKEELKNDYYIESEVAIMMEGAMANALGAVEKLVNGFLDFLDGALIESINTASKFKIPTVKTVKTKANESRKKVKEYWKEIQKIKGTEHEGKFAKIKNAISDVIAKFKKVYEDLKNAIIRKKNELQIKGALYHGSTDGRIAKTAHEVRGDDKKAKKYYDRGKESFVRAGGYANKFVKAGGDLYKSGILTRGSRRRY